MIAVPAAAVVDVARECGERGVRALVVISAGFAETGPEGAERQRELLEVCRAPACGWSGPNCLGIINTAPGARASTRPSPPTPPPSGDVGFVTQSGALGLALIDLASDRGLGVSSFGSIGNRADITANDFLEYWEATSETARGAALHRVVQRPAPLLPGRAAGRAREADRGRQERPLGRRGARDQLPHRARCWRPRT